MVLSDDERKRRKYERHKLWVEKNREKHRERNRKWAKENKSILLKNSKKYYEKNRKKILEINRRYKSQNQDIIRSYRLKNREKHRIWDLEYRKRKASAEFMAISQKIKEKESIMELITNDLQYADLSKYDSALLKKALSKGLELTAYQLKNMALIWAELEKRGEDLSELKTGLASFLSLIAQGALKADLVVGLAGKKTLLKKIAEIPLESQDRLCNMEYVDVCSISDDGQIVTKRKRLIEVNIKEAELLLYSGDLRSAEFQYRILESEIKRKTINRHKKSLKNIEDKSIYITKDNNTLFLNIPSGRARVSDILDVVINEMGSSRERFIKHFLSGDS